MPFGRVIIRFLLVLSLAYAPLLCLRFCQVAHAARMDAPHVDDAYLLSLNHTVGLMSHQPAKDSLHQPPLQEIMQMLVAMTDLVPASCAIFALLVILAMMAAPGARHTDYIEDIPSPPPKRSLQPAFN
jgi:hypothetical protein